VAETEAHVALWRAIREGRLASVTDTVEQVLGRKPITLEEWAKENAAAFCSSQPVRRVAQTHAGLSTTPGCLMGTGRDRAQITGNKEVTETNC